MSMTVAELIGRWQGHSTAIPNYDSRREFLTFTLDGEYRWDIMEGDHIRCVLHAPFSLTDDGMLQAEGGHSYAAFRCERRGEFLAVTPSHGMTTLFSRVDTKGKGEVPA